MFDGLTIAGAVSGLRRRANSIKSMIELRDIAMIQAKAIELQGVILATQQSAAAAQEAQLTLLDEVRQLKARECNWKANAASWNATSAPTWVVARSPTRLKTA